MLNYSARLAPDGDSLARRRRTEHMADRPGRQPPSHGPPRPGTPDRRRDAPYLLRDPGPPVGGAGADDADERPGRPLPLLPQPPVPRREPPGGGGLGAPGDGEVRPTGGGGDPHRRRAGRSGSGGADPRR